MISTNFRHISNFLIDTSPRGSDNRTTAKTACVAAKAISLLSAGYSVLSALSGAWVLPVIVSCVLDREVFIIAQNFERILTTYTGTSILPNRFISSLLKDTWIVGPFFRDLF